LNIIWEKNNQADRILLIPGKVEMDEAREDA
jgi:hypothetical protein